MTSDRQQRKLRGPDWTCWCCRLSMPSAAFDAEWPKQANIFDNCLSPGHWRRCKACDEAIGLARELNQANETVRCGSCNMHQIPELFAEGNRTCNACLLRDTFRLFCCYKCGESKERQEVFQIVNSETVHCCFTCAQPEDCLIDCTVCKNLKPAEDFRGHPRQVREQTVRRCKSCTQCDMCSQTFEDFRRFVCNSRTCVKCARRKQQFKCSKCTETKMAHEFPADVSRSPGAYGPWKTELLCTSCRTTREFACSACEETKVAEEFPADVA